MTQYKCSICDEQAIIRLSAVEGRGKGGEDYCQACAIYLVNVMATGYTRPQT